MAVATQSLRALKAEHERRTGCVENMRQYGWEATRGRFSERTGAPLEFTKLIYRISRNIQGSWYISVCSRVPVVVRGKAIYPTRPIGGPNFPGPVSAAIWLAVERPNGSD